MVKPPSIKVLLLLFLLCLIEKITTANYISTNRGTTSKKGTDATKTSSSNPNIALTLFRFSTKTSSSNPNIAHQKPGQAKSSESNKSCYRKLVLDAFVNFFKDPWNRISNYIFKRDALVKIDRQNSNQENSDASLDQNQSFAIQKSSNNQPENDELALVVHHGNLNKHKNDAGSRMSRDTNLRDASSNQKAIISRKKASERLKSTDEKRSSDKESSMAVVPYKEKLSWTGETSNQLKPDSMSNLKSSSGNANSIYGISNQNFVKPDSKSSSNRPNPMPRGPNPINEPNPKQNLLQLEKLKKVADVIDRLPGIRISKRDAMRAIEEIRSLGFHSKNELLRKFHTDKAKFIFQEKDNVLKERNQKINEIFQIEKEYMKRQQQKTTNNPASKYDKRDEGNRPKKYKVKRSKFAKFKERFLGYGILGPTHLLIRMMFRDGLLSSMRGSLLLLLASFTISGTVIGALEGIIASKYLNNLGNDKSVDEIRKKIVSAGAAAGAISGAFYLLDVFSFGVLKAPIEMARMNVAASILGHKDGAKVTNAAAEIGSRNFYSGIGFLPRLPFFEGIVGEGQGSMAAHVLGTNILNAEKAGREGGNFILSRNTGSLVAIAESAVKSRD